MGIAFIPVWRDRFLASDRVDDLSGPARGVLLQLFLHADPATGRLESHRGEPIPVERIRKRLRYAGGAGGLARMFTRCWRELTETGLLNEDPDGAFVIDGFASRLSEALHGAGKTHQAAGVEARPVQAATKREAPSATEIRETTYPDAPGQQLLEFLPGGLHGSGKTHQAAEEPVEFSTIAPQRPPGRHLARTSRASSSSAAAHERRRKSSATRARDQSKPSEAKRTTPPTPLAGGRGDSHESRGGPERRSRGRRMPRITTPMLERDELLGRLAAQLQDLGLAPPGERGEQLVFVHAEHARIVARDPPAMFARNVRDQAWSRGSDEADRRGHRRWKRWAGRVDEEAVA